MQKKSVLLINVGTPDTCEPKAVKRYLREFLMDPRVIDLLLWQRWMLVHLFILPFRTPTTTAAYKKIWQESGSPLLRYSRQMSELLQQRLGTDYQVELGMRYCNPSIADALSRFENTNELTIVPLFPQYSSAATGTALEKTLSILGKKWNVPAMKIVNEFYAHPLFISAYAELIKTHLADQSFDMLLFSYHGLPERHILKSECHATCNHLHACPKMSADNSYCYRAQCFTTSDLLAKALNLAPNQYATSFQSRLGRTPWIKPYTDLLLPQFIAQGKKRLAIVCPSFVADCLETLEEINVRARAQWQTLGGESFIFIPCLNDSPAWITALESIVTVNN